MMLMVFYYMDQKKDLSSHTPYKKIDIVAVRHFLKSLSLLIEGLFLIYIGYFRQIWLEYPHFLFNYETFRFKHLRRLTTDRDH